MSETTISNSFGFDATQAIVTIRELSGSFEHLFSVMKQGPQVIGQFNSIAKGVAGGLKGISPASVSAANGLERVGQAARQQRSGFDELISVHGRYSTSVALLSRVWFTQGAVSFFHTIRRGFQDAIQDAAELRNTLERIRSLSGQGINTSGGQAETIAARFGLNVVDAAKGIEAASQNINDYAQAVQVAGAAAGLATVTNGDYVTSVNALSSAVQTGLIPVDKLGDGVGKLLAAQKLGRIDVDGFEKIISKLGAQAQLTGISFDELLTSVASLTASGVSDSQAVTQLGNAMKAINKPSDEMRQALRGIGFESGQAAIKTLGFIQTVDRLVKFAGGDLNFLNKAFGQQTGLQGALNLTKDQQALTRYNEFLTEIKGSASEVANEMLKIVQSSPFKKLANDANQFAIAATKVAGAAVESFDDFIDGLAESTRRVAGWSQQAVAGIERWWSLLTNTDADRARMEADAQIILGNQTRMATEQAKLNDHQERLQQAKDAALTASAAMEAVHAAAVESASNRITTATRERMAAMRDFITESKTIADGLKNQLDTKSDPKRSALENKNEGVRLFDQGIRQGDQEKIRMARELLELSKQQAIVQQGKGAQGSYEGYNSQRAVNELLKEQLRLETELQNSPKWKEAMQPMQEQPATIPVQFDAAAAYKELFDQVSKSPITIPVQFAGQEPKNAWTGGYFNSGGAARGTDTIPAMLSPGEFVMNAKSSRKFFSQLNSMNSQGIYRQQGGAVGDMHFTVTNNHPTNEEYNIRQVAHRLERLRRRRVIR